MKPLPPLSDDDVAVAERRFAVFRPDHGPDCPICNRAGEAADWMAAALLLAIVGMFIFWAVWS